MANMGGGKNMNENISKNTKEAVENFRKLGDIKEIYFTSIILNHLNYGLINEGNFVDSDEAYEQDKLVLEPEYIGLENDTDLAIKLLLIATEMEGITVNPNGRDIEPYVKDIKEIRPVISKFYKLEYSEKLDFLAEIIYDISEVDEVKKIDFDFNGFINEIIDYRKETCKTENKNSLETE